MMIYITRYVFAWSRALLDMTSYLGWKIDFKSPAGEMALRAAPDFPGRTPPAFPERWLAPLRSA